MRASRRTLLAVLALTAGCAAPQYPVSIGFKEVPSDILLGGGSSAAVALPAAALPELSLVTLPAPATVIALPPATFAVKVGPELPRPVELPPVRGCLPVDPLQTPALEAPAQITAPPVPASYVYTHDGSYAISGADPRSGRFPPAALRTVGAAAGSPTDFTFDVTELLGDVTSTTTYQVVTAAAAPAPALAPATGAGLSPGLYLKKVTTGQAASTTTFSPAPALLLAGFPLVRGAAVTSSAVDPVTATTMRFTATVTGKTRVDACGVPLDSWVLDLTAGKIAGPTQNLDFTATYAVGTQYGGLLLRDRTLYSGTSGSDGVTRSDVATINAAPAPR